MVVEFARRYRKPIVIEPQIHSAFSITTLSAACSSRGLEFYGTYSWTELEKILKALRARKVLKNTNVLLASRFNSNASFSGVDTFVCQDEVTDKFGVKFRHVNLHELIDNMKPASPAGNYTTPGRITPNITEDEIKEAGRMADELIAGADEVHVDREHLVKSLIAYLTVRKLMELHGCNALTVPCPDACSTRRLNEEKFTFCLTHSLNHEQGIPSACEYDIDGVVTMMSLIAISGNAPYMGNTHPVPCVDGKLELMWGMEPEELEGVADLSNLYYTQHSVPGRKFKGIKGKAAKYGLRHFAYDQGFGAVFRYDFKQDAGQTITLARFSPDCTKLFAGKGTIVGGGGYDKNNCNTYLLFRVADQADFYKKQLLVGNHLPMVYGDHVEELALLGKMLGLEVITA
jgi:L-fucose isomerase-like protein